MINNIKQTQCPQKKKKKCNQLNKGHITIYETIISKFPIKLIEKNFEKK